MEELPEQKKPSHLNIPDLEAKIKECEADMKKAAKEMRFEDAARARDLMRYFQNLELMKADVPEYTQRDSKLDF